MTFNITLERSKFLGHRSSDPTTEELNLVGPGAWWYREDLGIFKYWDGSEIRYLPVKFKEASSGKITIPIGGGIVTGSIAASSFGLSKILAVVNVRVIRHEPVVADVYAPSVGINATGDAVGYTVAAGTGTTLELVVSVYGY